jgi:asparagine synthase (glutamine-hydrolysing)
MMAANSVEGRFPFLDHRVVEFCNSLPPQFRIRGLREKHILKKSAQGLLPPEIWQRRKQPYRAPIHSSFFDQRPEYVEHLLSEDAIRASDLFTPGGVARLTRKCQAGARLSEGDNMALVGILSTQLLHQMFIDEFPYHSPQDPQPLRICRGKEQNQ